MKVKLLLRAAAFLIFIHLLGHAAGHMGWKHPKDQKMQEVVNTMLDYHAKFMGASQSMGDYFNGYSLSLFLVFGLSIWVLWWVAGLTSIQPKIVKGILLPFALLYLGLGVIEWVYFFPFAAILSMTAGICILVALLSLPAEKKI